MNYSGILHCTVADGIGFRTSLYISGCKHHCEGCHNPETWSFLAGKPFTQEVEDVLFDRIDNDYIKGLTLSGGDPVFSIDDIVPLLERFRERFGNTKDVWLYTGFTIDELKDFSPLSKRLFELVDVIVDGRFKLDLRDVSLPFRGSSNQNIWKKNENGEFEILKLNK